MGIQAREGFWADACALHGSITPLVMPHVFAFGALASLICGAWWVFDLYFDVQIGLEVAPFEFAGTALGLLLILRTNAGYDRWWEARKLWGGIVNQSRNLAISALAYGPEDPRWRERFVRWTAAFSHVARSSLRGEPPCPEVASLVGEEDSRLIVAAGHMPGFVALELGKMLKVACDQFNLDRFAFLQIDKERATLIDHIGACERILKTPLPIVYSIKIRRFIALFLLTLPFALLNRVEGVWLIPLITMMVAYPLVSLDQIGIELQNPFSVDNLSHLPLDSIAATIQQNLEAYLKEHAGGARSS